MNDIPEQAQPGIDAAFLSVLENHNQGAIITDVSAALKRVTAAVQQTGKGGKVTLTMNLRPASAGGAGTLVLETTIKTTVPEVKPAGSIFYANDDFNLVRDDPKQRRLNLQVVPAEPKAAPVPLPVEAPQPVSTRP